jgi:2-methylisocitrate lyase-like PEP mutase family enzyme
MSMLTKFSALHHGHELFLLPNAWDARSAIMLEQNGFKAIGTSSAAVANSLGYEDGENMPFSDYLFVVKRILSSVKIPVTIDIETGYGKNKEEVAENIIAMIKLGVSGINIEDSVIDEKRRTLQDPNTFASSIYFIKEKLSKSKLDLFINIRTDGYILNVEDKEAETIRRVKIYNEAGADGIFVPCISRESDIEQVVQHSKLPINVMAIPGLPNFTTLNNLGVKRVSMGPFMFHKVYSRISELTKAIETDKSVSPITE